MTTGYALDTSPLPDVPRSTTRRLLNVGRLHAASVPLLITWPVAIVVSAFAIAFLIFLVIGEQTNTDTNFTGGVFSLYGFAMVFYIQAMTLTFPYALGLSVTRREYYTATTLVALVQSAVFGTALYLLALVERATDGWGVQMRMFDIPAYFTDNQLLQWSLTVSTLLFVGAVGMLIGVVYQRWRTSGMFALAIGTLLVLGGAAVLITWQQWWTGIGTWFVDTPRVITLLLLPAALAAMTLAATWGALRRAMVR